MYVLKKYVKNQIFIFFDIHFSEFLKHLVLLRSLNCSHANVSLLYFINHSK